MPTTLTCAARSILLVEDEDDDALLLQRCLRRIGLGEHVHRVETGQNAIAHLNRFLQPGALESLTLPALILLDIKIPLPDGHSVLEWIRAQPPLARLQVYMLSGSTLDSDRDRATKNGADGFWQKSGNLRHYEELALKIQELMGGSPGSVQPEIRM